MKKNIIYAVVIVALLIVQTTVVPVVFGHEFPPDLVLMFALAWTIRDGFTAFLSWLVLAGLAYDALTYLPPGTHVLIFVSSAYLVSFFSRRFLVQIRGVGLALMLFLVLLSTLFSQIFMALTDGIAGSEGLGYFLRWIFANWQLLGLQFVFNTGAVFFALWATKQIKRYFFLQ